ncbi:MAG TPA: hypothetical protein VNH43_11975, partial [Vicinamibacteria bacterium]|nr:hypothetical protein [Vicinamibacteria bacterium]
TAQYMGSLTGDGNGSAVAVWIPIAGAGEGAAIVARRFAPSTGWTPVETIDPPGPNLFQDPVAAMDAQGAIMAVWPERSGLLASRFVAGSGWGAPTRISREYSSPFTSIQAAPAVGFYSGGRALAVWSECCGGSGAFEIGSNRFDPATGWLTPDGVWAIGARDVSAPALAVAANGSALAVWAEADASRLWMSTFDPRRGWAVSQPIALLAPAQLLYGVRAALNAAGDGFALWTQDDTLFASRYTTVTGFATPQALGRGGSQGLAVDSAGNALALWVQPPRLLALRYTAGRGWEAPVPLPPQDANGSGALSMDAGGNAWFVWGDSTGVWSRRYVVGQGLGLAERISPATGSDLVFGGLQVVAEAQGGAVAAWLEPLPGTSSWSILANRYVAR